MKNFKKIVSFVLAVCLMASLAIGASAANTVDTSGGTGTSSVTLSSTADGSIGGDPAATKMSVTVPIPSCAMASTVLCDNPSLTDSVRNSMAAAKALPEKTERSANRRSVGLSFSIS